MSQEARALVVQYLLGQVQQPEQAIEEFCKLNSSVSPPSDAASPDAETAYAQLKSYVRHILGLIKEDNLALAGTELVQISQWVKTNAVNLGMPPAFSPFLHSLCQSLTVYLCRTVQRRRRFR